MKPRFQCVVVFDNAIVNNGDFTGIIRMRVGIDGVWLAVSGPAGMADTKGLGTIGLT